MMNDKALDQLKDDIILNQNLKNQNRAAERSAGIRNDRDLRPRWTTRMVIALDTATTFLDPYIITDEFDGFYVEDATDTSTSVKMAFTSPESHQTINYLTLKKSDSMAFSSPVGRGILSWAAQAGKSITLVLFIGARFQTGSMRQELVGGVTITTGTGMTPQTSVSVGVAATLIAAADSSRKMATIQNLSAADVFISGTNAVTTDGGTKPGIKLTPGDVYEFTGQGAIYGIASAAASTVSLNTES